MQKHPLISVGDLKKVTDLVRAEPLDVAERDHFALGIWERLDGGADARTRLRRDCLGLGIITPACRWRCPVPGGRRTCRVKAVGIDGGIAGFSGGIA